MFTELGKLGFSARFQIPKIWGKKVPGYAIVLVTDMETGGIIPQLVFAMVFASLAIRTCFRQRCGSPKNTKP